MVVRLRGAVVMMPSRDHGPGTRTTAIYVLVLALAIAGVVIWLQATMLETVAETMQRLGGTR